MSTRSFALLAGIALMLASGRPATAQLTAPAAPNTAKLTTDPNAANAASRTKRTLGVLVNDDSTGVVISQVDDDTVAEHAGLLIGDRIVAVNGQHVRTHEELIAALRASDRQSGLLLVERRGDVRRFPLNWTSGSVRRETGYRALNDEFKFNGVGNGLRVVHVPDGSWMQTSGLMPHDRIISLNRTPVTTRAQLIALLEDSAGSDGIGEMLVDRGGSPTRVELHLTQGMRGPGSLSDVSNISGANGDLEAAIGNLGNSGSTADAIANGTAAPTTPAGSVPSGATSNRATTVPSRATESTSTRGNGASSVGTPTGSPTINGATAGAAVAPSAAPSGGINTPSGIGSSPGSAGSSSAGARSSPGTSGGTGGGTTGGAGGGATTGSGGSATGGATGGGAGSGSGVGGSGAGSGGAGSGGAGGGAGGAGGAGT